MRDATAMREPLAEGPVLRPRGQVLLADADPAVLLAAAHALGQAGYAVTLRSTGQAALAALEAATFDTVVADLDMPGGAELVRRARSQDADLPIIAVDRLDDRSGGVHAVAHGLHRYLIRPVDSRLLVTAVREAVRLRELARLRRATFQTVERSTQEQSRGHLVALFESALAALAMRYQPIVCLSGRSIFGYEALARTDMEAISSPGSLISVARAIDRLPDLGRAVRGAVAAQIETSGASRIFVNLHPDDLLDPDLARPDAPLSRVADRVALEITETTPLFAIADLRGRLAELKRLGFHLALHDLGAASPALSTFARIHPEIVKLDRSLVRGIDGDTAKQKHIRSLVNLCDDLGIRVVAQGVETGAERAALVAVGCDLLQGYLFARPGPAFPPVSW